MKPNLIGIGAYPPACGCGQVSSGPSPTTWAVGALVVAGLLLAGIYMVKR